MFKLYLDAGHGGKDSGATGYGITEKDANLKIALAIQDYLTKNFDNVEIKMTRTTDVFLSLKERTDSANEWGADFFLSIHCNSGANPNASGFGSYTYLTSDARTKAAQNVIHSEVMKLIPEMKDYGQHQADFHVVRVSQMPAMLTENGFVSNSRDANLLGSQQFINRLAEGHSKGLASFFGLTRKAGEKMTKDYAGHWAEKDIDRAIQLGIMQGFADGTFKPDEPVTRAQLAVVALRVLDRKG